MLALKKIGNAAAAVLLVMLALMQGAYASEIDLKVPSLDVGYNIWGYAITGSQILMYGIGIGAGFLRFNGCRAYRCGHGCRNRNHARYRTD